MKLILSESITKLPTRTVHLQIWTAAILKILFFALITINWDRTQGVLTFNQSKLSSSNKDIIKNHRNNITENVKVWFFQTKLSLLSFLSLFGYNLLRSVACFQNQHDQLTNHGNTDKRILA